MAQSTSNLVTPQQGLVSTNPFLKTGGGGLNLATGGTTTPLVGGTTGGSVAGITYGSGTSTPVTSNINFNAGSSAQSGIIPIANAQGMGGNSSAVRPLAPGGYGYNADGTITNNAGQAPPTGGNNNGVLPSGTNLITNPGAGGGAIIPVGGNNTNPYTASAPTFPGLVGGLAGTSSQPTAGFTTAQNTAQTAAQDLLNSTPEQSAAVQGATTNLQDLQNQYANQSGIIGNSPIGLSEQGGEQGLLNQQYASKLGAAQTAVQNALAGNAQIQSAYTGAGSTANTTAGEATGQQSTQQQGLGTAAGLVQPSLAAPGQSYANPETGTFGNIAGAQNGGGIASVGGLQTQIGQGAAVQQMTGIYQQAQGLASTLTSAINSSGYNPAQGIGPATTYANGVNQWLQTNSGNPQYQNVANLVSEVANKYAAILNQSGGTPTSVSQVQQQIINGLASGQQIETTLGNLATNAQTSIDALKKASGTNSVNGGSNNSSSNLFSPAKFY